MAGKGKENKRPNTIEVCTEIAMPILEELGLSLWDVVFEKEGSLWFLRYFIDKEGGVDINDCENFSRKVDKVLDERDPISQNYYLEVSSPGIERDISKDWHFDACMGYLVSVRFIRPIDGERDFIGELCEFEKGKITIILEDESRMSFEKSETAYIRLYDDYLYDYNGGESE